MNLPNPQYFKWSSAYAGAPIKESEVLFKEVADKYKRTEDLYNTFNTAMGSIEAPDENSKNYLNSTKDNLKSLIGSVVKDTQGNVRYEQAEQVIKEAALKFKNDRTIQHIMKTNNELAKQKESLYKLQAEGKAPVGRGDLGENARGKFKAIEIDPITKEIKYNTLQGWYEPRGAYDEAYSELSSSLGYEVKDKLADIQNRMAFNKPVTADEKAMYDNNIATMVANSKSKPEIDQDYAVLLDRFNGNTEKVNDFILNQRIKPSLNSKDPTQVKMDLSTRKQTQTFQNSLDMQEQKAINQEKRAELAYLRSLEKAKIEDKREVLAKTTAFDRAVSLDELKTDNRIELKQTVGGGTTNRGGGAGTRAGTGNSSVSSIGISSMASSAATAMFEDLPEENNVESNPYSSPSKGLTYDPITKTIIHDGVEQSKALEPSNQLGSTGLPTKGLKEMQAKIMSNGDKEMKRFNDFVNAVKVVKIDGKDTNFKSVGKEQQLKIYQSSLASDSELFKEIASPRAVDGLDKGMKAYFKTAYTLSSTTAYIKGGNEKDTKTLMAKLEESGLFTPDDLSSFSKGNNVAFSGIRVTGTPGSNLNLLGGLIYNISGSKGGAQIIVPSTPALKGIVSVYNNVVNSAVRQTLSDSQANRITAGTYINADNLIAPGIYLEPHKEFDKDSGTQVVKFKPVMRNDKDNGYQMITPAFRELYRQQYGVELEDYFSLKDLKNITLVKIGNTGFFQEKAKSSKDVASLPTQ